MISILNSIAHHFSEINACFPAASCGQLRQNAKYAIMLTDTIFRETIGSGSSATIMGFIYDNQGLPFALNYSTNNGSSFTTYYYVLNLQGDVVKLVDGGGTSVASYAYDAWGKILSSSGSKAEINPLRYRGYYYDTETGFYYLQSRYYDPVTHRFINADAPEYSELAADSLDDTNLFAYCSNNPVMRTDENGELWGWIKKAAAVVAVTAAVVTATVVTCVTCGAGSVAGVAMISATVTMAARATEVGILQGRKSANERKSNGKIATDVVEAIFDNGSKIIGLTPVTKSAGIALNHGLSAAVEKSFGGTQTLSATLKSTGGKVMPYAFAAVAWVRTAVSAFSKDPVERAKSRRYQLK